MRFHGQCLARKGSDLIQESPTLELASDCSRFVTQHFEVITASAPHIYHSALVLTPRESIVRKLYESHLRPFVRVVQGVPTLLDLNVTAATYPPDIQLAIWSPCNRFIAISPPGTASVNVLDSATLHLLQSLKFSQESLLEPMALAFSPDSRTLTSFLCGYPDTRWFVVSWDLQTGGVVGAIEWGGLRYSNSNFAYMTHSTSGETVAILSVLDRSVSISIYDISSSVYMHDVFRRAPSNIGLSSISPNCYNIWTHGELLRFSTPEPTGITIREVAFTPRAKPVTVETVSIPEDIVNTFVHQYSRANAQFHPPSRRIALVGPEGSLLVWDSRASRSLLHGHPDIRYDRASMSFSSDGRFFACATKTSEVSLWKESSTGYAIVQRFATSSLFPIPLLSLNGESIITFRHSTIQLWHTQSFTTTTSTILPRVLQDTVRGFLLDFHPDKPLAAITRLRDQTVTVLDLKSGIPQLTIDTSIEVYGLKQIGNTIVIIGDQKTITWDLLGGELPPDARMNVQDSSQTIHSIQNRSHMDAASISFDFQYIARGEGYMLDVYSTSTSTTQYFRVQDRIVRLWFAPGTHDLWCANYNGEPKVFTITQDASHHMKIVARMGSGTWEFPWRSSCGYQVTNEGWVLCQNGKRLFMLPPLWRSLEKVERVWNEKFLALTRYTLLEPVILELEP